MPHDSHDREAKEELNYITEDGELNVQVMFEAVMVNIWAGVIGFNPHK